MLVTSQPVFKRFWYPVIPVKNLLDGPKSFTLLEQNLVLWLDNHGQPAVAIDRCCHRSARLSKGIVVDGNIRCPYHGWVFNPAGKCVQVPQHPGAAIPHTYQVETYHCAERYGYVWVCLGEPLDTIPEIAQANNSTWRTIHTFYQPINCSGLRLMENLSDMAHHHYVHNQTLGDRENPIPIPLESFSETENGIYFKCLMHDYNNPLKQKSWREDVGDLLLMREFTWYLPFSAAVHLTFPSGLQQITLVAGTPINDSTSQFISIVIRNDTEAETKTSDIIAFSDALILEDKDILEITDYDVPLDLSQEQHMASDQPGIIMRRKLAVLLKNHQQQELKNTTSVGVLN